MAACLSGKDLSQSILLGLACLYLQIERDLPSTFHHVAGRIHGNSSVESFQRRIAEVALLDVPGKHRRALAACRRAQENTGTREITSTGFKIRSGNFPRVRHGGLLSDCRSFRYNTMRR